MRVSPARGPVPPVGFRSPRSDPMVLEDWLRSAVLSVTEPSVTRAFMVSSEPGQHKRRAQPASRESRLTRGARGQPARPGGEFFAQPAGPHHRRYEALRGYLYEGLSAPDAAARGRYSVATLRSMVRDFRAGKIGFFLAPRPGPTRAPAKNAARQRIIELRRAGHSATEIAEILAGTPTPLNRTGVAEVLAEAGFPGSRSPSWSPWTCPAWSPRPATQAHR